MALQDMTPADLAAVMGNNDNDGFGNGNGWWIILLFLFLGWGNRGWSGGGNGAGDASGDVLYPWMNQAQNTWQGFSNVQQDLCNGFAGVTAAVTNGFAQSEIADNARQIANMQQQFALSQQFSNCCCENRLGLANLGADIAREACADRAAVSDGVRDILANQTASVQRILDQMCQDKIDAKNDEIAQLRQELLYSRGQASQVAQTAQMVDQVYNRLSTCPVGTVPVYGEQPIFTCGCNAA